MKNNSYAIATGLFASLCFSQLAFSSALKATCTNVDKNTENAQVLQVVVEDDWATASIFPPNDTDTAVSMQCSNGPRTENADFKCEWEYDMQGLLKVTTTFVWDTDNNINVVFGGELNADLAALTGQDVDLGKEIYECVVDSDSEGTASSSSEAK